MLVVNGLSKIKRVLKMSMKESLKKENSNQVILPNNDEEYLRSIENIEKWIKRNDTPKLPSAYSKIPMERNLARQFHEISILLVQPYKELKSEIQKEIYVVQHPKIKEIVSRIDKINSDYYLYVATIKLENKAREIIKWLDETGNTRLPVGSGKNKKETNIKNMLKTFQKSFSRICEEFKTEEQRKEYLKNYPEIEDLQKRVTEITTREEKIKEQRRIILKLDKYLSKAIEETCEWLESNQEIPNLHSTNEQERMIAKNLIFINTNLIMPYLEIKDFVQREEYKQDNSKFEKAIKILRDIYFRAYSEEQSKKNIGYINEIMEIYERVVDEDDVSKYLKNAIKIKLWIEKSGDTVPPTSISKDQEEKKLGMALSTIRQRLLKKYLKLEGEEKSRFEVQFPDIKVIMQIVKYIDLNNISPNLKKAREIKEWIENSDGTKPPSPSSKNEEERRLGTSLSSIRCRLIKPYLELENDEEKRKYEEKYPYIKEILEIINWIDKNNTPTHLRNARKIKEWIESNGEIKTPSSSSKNEEEQTLAKELSAIRIYLINPYLDIKNEDEKSEYEQKHPELKEVMEIINWIDTMSTHLKNARKIKKWIENSGDVKPPRTIAEEKEEKKLGLALTMIRHDLIKPYLELEDEEERRIYKIEHPDFTEVMEIVNWIDKNNISPYLINARKIQVWQKENEEGKLLSCKSKDKEERKLAESLRTIKRKLIAPYLQMEDEYEKSEYEQKHPELEEVMEITYNVEKNGRVKKQREFAEAIHEELKRFVAKHVESNQEIRSELSARVKEINSKTNNLGGKDD